MGEAVVGDGQRATGDFGRPTLDATDEAALDVDARVAARGRADGRVAVAEAGRAAELVVLVEVEETRSASVFN